MPDDLMTAEEAQRAMRGRCPCPYCERACRTVAALAAERERYRAALEAIATTAGDSRLHSTPTWKAWLACVTTANDALNPAEAP